MAKRELIEQREQSQMHLDFAESRKKKSKAQYIQANKYWLFPDWPDFRTVSWRTDFTYYEVGLGDWLLWRFYYLLDVYERESPVRSRRSNAFCCAIYAAQPRSWSDCRNRWISDATVGCHPQKRCPRTPLAMKNRLSSGMTSITCKKQR